MENESVGLQEPGFRSDLQILAFDFPHHLNYNITYISLKIRMKFNWLMQLTYMRQGSVETVGLKRQRYDCGSFDGYMQASHHEYQKRLVV